MFQASVKVKEQLIEKIKVESLRTYLFSFSSVYDSISLDKLAASYELERAVVHSTISKMIINEELAASMDEPSQCAIMHRTDPTHLQSLALQLSEKVQALVDYNEKLMEMKSGNFSFQRQNFQGELMLNMMTSLLSSMLINDVIAILSLLISCSFHGLTTMFTK